MKICLAFVSLSLPEPSTAFLSLDCRPYLILCYWTRCICVGYCNSQRNTRLEQRRSKRGFVKSVATQVSGEAVYTDDMPSPVGTLYVGLVLSTKPHAKLLGVDPSEALKLEGVMRYVGSGDVTPERIAIGVIVRDEEVFAVSEVWTPLATFHFSS